MTPPYIQEALKRLKPPEHLTVSEWAEKYRVMPSTASAKPGPWSNEFTPYLVDIMDEINNPDSEDIVFVKPTQVGGTEVLLNIAGYIAAQDPSPIIIVLPTDEIIKQFSDGRLRTMIEATPALRERYDARRSTQEAIAISGTHIRFGSANSVASLASWPMRILLLDEVDKYPGASTKEASPIKLAEERLKTYRHGNGKKYMCSTPTIADNHIWRAMEAADVVKHYKVPCPHCGEYIELDFNQVRWPDNQEMGYSDRADLAWYACPVCGGVIEDARKPGMLRAGKWCEAVKRSDHKRTVAYHLNALYSPFVYWSDAAREFLRSKDDPDMLQNFRNSWLAEPWEDRQTSTSADMVLDAQSEHPEFVVPPDAEMLTGGIDVQIDRVYWSIRAWGKHGTSWGIAHGEAASLEAASFFMNRLYEKPNGDALTVELCAIDSGFNADRTYEFCFDNPEWSIPVRGSNNPIQGGRFQLRTVDRIHSRANGIQYVRVDGGQYKDTIFDRLRRKAGVGAWQVYAGCDREFAAQIASEIKVKIRRGGVISTLWKPRTSHTPNHYLDTEVYSYAAADLCGARVLHLQEAPRKPKAEQAEAQYTPRMAPANTGRESGDWLGGSVENWL